MKEKKNASAKKVLLVLTAALLTAAVSVGATLAYLTAQTDMLSNEFKANGSISGDIGEPKWNVTAAGKFKPGDEIDKDPLVRNLTTDTDVYAGVRLDFYIYQETDAGVLSGTPTKVPYNVFKAFVDYAYDSTHEYDSSKWTELTDQKGTGSKYYFYNTILKAHDGTDLTSTISGTYANNKADCSTPVFKTVTPKSTIVIRELTTNETNNGTKYSTSYTASGPSGVYKSFKFDIVITGYGVKSDIGAANAQTAILHELGGTDTTV